jgi:hypothetical protein
VHFRKDELKFGFRCEILRELARFVDSLDWASDGVLANHLAIDIVGLQQLTIQLASSGFLSLSDWEAIKSEDQYLADVETRGDDTRFWHITNEGKALAKSYIGEPLDRTAAQKILDATVARIAVLMEDENAILKILDVDLCGSLLDSKEVEFGDVDLIIHVRRDHTCSFETKAQFEDLIKDGNDRLDVMVYDGTNWNYPIDGLSPTRRLLP